MKHNSLTAAGCEIKATQSGTNYVSTINTKMLQSEGEVPLFSPHSVAEGNQFSILFNVRLY